MKIRIEKEVSIASAFTHLIAAWDYDRLPWYRSVVYTEAGRGVIFNDAFEPLQNVTLATVRVDAEEGDKAATVRIDGRWIKRALEACLAQGGYIAEAALKIINEDASADQNTADVVMQVGAYGRIVFG